MITFVYAQDENGTIGYQNAVPWKLPNDMAFFKQTTMGHTMLMGRKTFESMNQRLLPGRKTVVMTSQNDYGKDIEGLIVIHSVEEALALAKDQNLMVIGGASLFDSLEPYVDTKIRTMIYDTFPSDVKVEAIDETKWKLVKTQEGLLDDKNQYPHQFEWWQRKETSEA